MKFLWQICLFCLMGKFVKCSQTLNCPNFSLIIIFTFHFILINLNFSFDTVNTLFMVSNVNIRHFSKIRQICQDS